MDLKHGRFLALQRCPYCAVLYPNLAQHGGFETENHRGTERRYWATYLCNHCGGVVLACSPGNQAVAITMVLPAPKTFDEAIPERARQFLSDAAQSVPTAGVLLAAGAVDAMLKAKGYKDGSLYSRIEQAEAERLITPEIKVWAHEVRLDANDQRHSDENAPLPETDDLKRIIAFAEALAHYLFVLPSWVTRGRARDAKQ